MALAHLGNHVEAPPRLRILLGLCELQQAGTPATYRLLQRRLGMSSGAFTHHVERLQTEDLITRSRSAGTLELTARALAQLITDAWLVQSRPVVAYELSTAAVEVLEIAAPADEAQSSDASESQP